MSQYNRSTIPTEMLSHYQTVVGEDGNPLPKLKRRLRNDELINHSHRVRPNSRGSRLNQSNFPNSGPAIMDEIRSKKARGYANEHQEFVKKYGNVPSLKSALDARSIAGSQLGRNHT